jgi:hypothetical protein
MTLDNASILPLLLMLTTVPIFFVSRFFFKIDLRKSLPLSASLPGLMIPILKFEEIYRNSISIPTSLSGIILIIFLFPALWIFPISFIISIIYLKNRRPNEYKLPLYIVMITGLLLFVYIFTYLESGRPF